MPSKCGAAELRKAYFDLQDGSTGSRQYPLTCRSGGCAVSGEQTSQALPPSILPFPMDLLDFGQVNTASRFDRILFVSANHDRAEGYFADAGKMFRIMMSNI
jgi:hypothetical protein